jgi:GTP-binding protein
MFKVCMVGRANVGKSSIFNRIIKYKKALVSATPNLTRDRNHGICEWKNKQFCFIDTGGVEKEDGSFEKNWIVKNVSLGLDEADMVLMIVDGKEGLNPLDKDILKWVKTRVKKKKIILVVNKVDSKDKEDLITDFYTLGLEKMILISAIHNLGITDILNEIVENITDEMPEKTENDKSDIKIALVGKPNVGKSSLLNKILGEERVLVSDIPGTTRDSIDTNIEKNGVNYMLIDTAGIKKNSKKSEFDYISIEATEESIKRSDICLLMMDADSGVNHQDLRISGLISEHRRACIIVVNKWDLIEWKEDYVKKFLDDRKKLFPYLLYAPVIFISAKEGIRVEKIFSLIDHVYSEFIKRAPDVEISQLFRDCYHKKYPPRYQKKFPVVILGGKQLDIAPPLFYVKVSKNGGLNNTYARYLENNIRYKYKYEGVPIRIIWRNNEDDENN